VQDYGIIEINNSLSDFLDFICNIKR